MYLTPLQYQRITGKTVEELGRLTAEEQKAVEKFRLKAKREVELARSNNKPNYLYLLRNGLHK